MRPFESGHPHCIECDLESIKNDAVCTVSDGMDILSWGVRMSQKQVGPGNLLLAIRLSRILG